MRTTTLAIAAIVITGNFVLTAELVGHFEEESERTPALA